MPVLDLTEVVLLARTHDSLGFAALFVVFRRLNRDTSAIITVLVINLIFSFSVSSISLEAHLGGLITGALVGVALAYAPRALRTQVLVAVVAATVLVLGALVAIKTAALATLPPAPPGL